MPSVRWLAVGVLVLASSLNYLDRQLLAALAPELRSEFQLSNEQYGLVVSVFSIVYALAAPVAGWLLDRIGLYAGAALAVAAWSAAGAATGLTSTFPGLLACRTALGVAEAAGLPANGKANGTYLEPREYAIGTALNQVGITLGATVAPLLAASLGPRYGWRSVFVLCGVLGFAWLPLWWVAARRAPPRVSSSEAAAPVTRLLRDPRLWALGAANVFVMTLYALWTNWTTLYFVVERGLSPNEANQSFAWIPPVVATAGGFCGAFMAWVMLRRGMDVLRVRMRICWTSAIILLGTAAVPWMPSPGWAAAAISLSFFWTLAISTNLYALPLDLFGARHAGFSVAILTSAFGLTTALVSPWIGRVVDQTGFTAVCVALAGMPLIGVAILSFAARRA
jgi:ACS family hexuronate transporter-like MFS transporter